MINMLFKNNKCEIDKLTVKQVKYLIDNYENLYVVDYPTLSTIVYFDCQSAFKDISRVNKKDLLAYLDGFASEDFHKFSKEEIIEYLIETIPINEFLKGIFTHRI